MKDAFVWLDQWDSKLNFFRETNYWRKVMLGFVVFSVGLWAIFGFDSGVGMLERLISNLPKLLNNSWTYAQWIDNAYAVYGVTFHFSAFVIYGLLFVGLSWWFEKIGIGGSKNLFLTLNLCFFNVTIFEHFYMASYAMFQTNRYFIQWYIEDLSFLSFYLIILVGGVYASLFFWADSHILNDRHIIGRYYSFQPTRELTLSFILLLGSIFLWWFFPFPFESVGSKFFPQTNYAGVYIQNDLIHAVNTLVKALFALAQFMIFKQFRRITR